MLQSSSPSIETRSSWIVATVALCLMALSYGAPWIAIVALKPIAAEAGGLRSVPALASSLAWFGSGFGGIAMGRIAERTGVRWTVMFGGIMIGVGLALSTAGVSWQLAVGHGLFIGVLGLGGISAPLYVYVSKWFDRRRGSALALISSGTYVAGAVWPPVFQAAIARLGWRETMLCYAAFVILAVVPLAASFLSAPPTLERDELGVQRPRSGMAVLGWPPNVVFAILAAASFMCCVTMAMPQGHLVAFCTDLGINANRGAVMLSVLLGTAFLSRQVWGLISDRIGGLATLLVGSAAQATAMTGFLLIQDEAGLFAVAAAFGLGFSGLIPAYVLAVRQLFPAQEASWRIPVLLLCSALGMAAGGWLAGWLYDQHGFYGPAFTTGIVFNLLNFASLTTLFAREHYRPAFS